MADSPTSVLGTIDAQLDALFAGWNIYSTLLAVGLVGYLFYPLIFGAEPDTHPLLLARQASPSPVRQSGESATYRALDVPYGYSLRSGLRVKDEGASKWSPGRDGDLRDIWREAAKPRPSTERPLQILSVKGKDEPVSHDVSAVSKEINIIGKHIQSLGAKRVAIYLPNSVEFLVALFASVFYGASPVLISPGQSEEVLKQILQETKVEIVFAPAGVVSQNVLVKSSSHLKNIVWFVERTSRHMDFLEEEVGNNSTTYHDLVEANKENANSELPSDTNIENAPNVISVWQGKNPSSYEIIEFTQTNIIAGIAAQATALQRDSRFESKDLVLSLEPLTLMFPLTVMCAALFSHTSIAFTSVAGSAPDFDLAFQRIKPTVVIASAETIAQAQARQTKENQGLFQQIHRYRQASWLAAGTMRGANTLLNQQSPRLIFTSERAGADSVPLSPRELTDLRIFTGARVVYALTTAKVAGPVAQTHLNDYREDPSSERRSHFGAPPSSVEIKVVDSPHGKIPEEGYTKPTGHLVVSGPAVVGETVNTGILAKFGDDNTLSLV